MYKFSKSSLAKLTGVHPDMVKVVTKALTISSVDFSVIEGVRTVERQKELWAQGRTKPGPIVTWTMNSKHFIDPKTGYGHAVDLLPVTGWNDQEGFKAVATAMLVAAEELNIKIRWGADWDMDGKPYEKGEIDSPHFELV